ncbi:peptide chain release factor 1-like, mitochondrial isoform X1 [Halyomorpha halys]|uniref:peptide chain release factor 1-like, mitochondrial isoform X1 n=1 Tax=Halyomorpha halys TaxID=286706 RepID=UPI0006D4DB3B|nr:peptide chain release factor 1-like, mitochondrial isoform X1 [Halyomorpha halys]
MFSLGLRNVSWNSVKSIKSMWNGQYLVFKCFYNSRECLNSLIRSEEIKAFFNKLQSDEVFLSNYSSCIKNPEVRKYVGKRKELLESLSSLLDLEKARMEEDFEFKTVLDIELKEVKDRLSQLECQLLDAVVPKAPSSNEIILEINAGVGGQEAMLFAKSIYDMYCGFIDYKNWNITTEEVGVSDLGGLRHASIFIEGHDALTYLRQESGVHRVQRVPSTERAGRIHTSTAAVIVLPQPREIDVDLNPKDLIIETKRSSGAGGQHVNKTESAVRITHLPTRISVECQTDRSQIRNREIAFQKLRAKLYELQQREQTTTNTLSRKLQMGTSARSDKVRTYNFPQDRITDHRILKTMHNIPKFLEGREMLEALITELILDSDKLRFEQFTLNLKEKEFYNFVV